MSTYFWPYSVYFHSVKKTKLSHHSNNAFLSHQFTGNDVSTSRFQVILVKTVNPSAPFIAECKTPQGKVFAYNSCVYGIFHVTPSLCMYVSVCECAYKCMSVRKYTCSGMKKSLVCNLHANQNTSTFHHSNAFWDCQFPLARAGQAEVIVLICHIKTN